ncbi:MAG: 1-deoxy-D-xylulose-5-phosphate synthase [Candidatus Eisenbacteria bacterium]|nr:1-deoxy-D-xylulose-5-phosphate synthase [Candidatus Eisenbacteria bacterium]
MAKLLDKINSPEDLKKLSINELPLLANEIRESIIGVVSKTGGHLAASLGAVEIGIAVHYVFDSPRDKIVWDVGHQSYCHKILTGRKDVFPSLRQFGGISGFPKREESVHDAFGTGHASTSVSAALGLACARDLAGESYYVVAVVGDGGLTGGLAYEGLNQAGDLKTNLIVIINDNGMSISPNVGAMARYFTRVISTRAYRRIEARIWEALGRIPAIGSKARYFGRRFKEGVRSIVVPNIIFEELGFKYYGPLEGHNLHELIPILRQLREVKGPIVLHMITKKGKGYKFAEDDATLYHGVTPFDKTTGESEETSKETYTDVFGRTACELGGIDKRLVAVTAAMTDNAGFREFAELYPDRFFDVGIAEEHAVTFSAGLAANGMRPIVAIYSTFLQRAYDQIIHDVSLQKLKIVFAIDRAGIVGQDGPTHHGPFDMVYLRVIPGMRILAPKDENELRDMLFTAVKIQDGPVAIRFPRSSISGAGTRREMKELELGKAVIEKNGDDLYILAIGSMVHPSILAAEILEKKGISAGVLNARFLKPLDEEMISGLAQRTKVILTVEEGALNGGFGSAVLECLEKRGLSHVAVKRLGIPDTFIEHGPRALLLQKLGLTAEGIAQTALKWTGAKFETEKTIQSRARS